jgi:hypothetical protein
MHPERITQKKLFLAGTDEARIYGEQHFCAFPGGTVSFTVRDLQPLEETEKVLPESSFGKLLDQLQGAKKSLISYRSAEGLKLYCMELPEHLIVISAGEFQPGLHHIYIEGVFRKRTTNEK